MTNTISADELAAVLGSHGFTAASDHRTYRHDLLVMLTDGDTTRVNVAAREPGTTQRFG